MKLPVFTISSTVAPAEHLQGLARVLFPRSDVQTTERGATVEWRSPTGLAQADVSRGGLWAADHSRLWTFDPTRKDAPSLLPADEAQKRAVEVLSTHGLMSEFAAPFRLSAPRVTGAMTAVQGEGERERRMVMEDTTVVFDVEIDLSTYDVGQKTAPMVGGGGQFSVMLGHAGQLQGVMGVWRPPVGKPTLHAVIPREKADQIYAAWVGKMPVKEFSATLAYYAAPSFSGQDQLFPVYVYSGVADFNGQRVELRKALIPATEIGTLPTGETASRRRSKSQKSVTAALPADLTLRPGQPLPPGLGLNLKQLARRGMKIGDFFLPANAGAPLVIKPDLNPAMFKELSNLLGFYSAGSSWIGLSGGLPGSRNNAQGFVDEMGAQGWRIRFNWGDGAAWESDWRANDDQWVDAVDFVFYTGHANSDGWVLATPDDTFISFSETAGALDLWGANNLEWAVVAACGPLQDAVVGSGGDVLDRWRSAFDGLHLLMGYAQVTYDNEEEGRRLASYARSGMTLMQSWFRAAKEIQGNGIWAGAYYLGNGAGSTADDHLWGVGSVGPDITAPTWRACTWVPC